MVTKQAVVADVCLRGAREVPGHLRSGVRRSSIAGPLSAALRPMDVRGLSINLRWA